MATDPDILLLDEPFTGLDVSVQMALRIELASHLRDFEGITLLVTHDAIDALTLADQVLVLDDRDVGPDRPTRRGGHDATHPACGSSRGSRTWWVMASTDVLFPDAVVVSLSEPEGSARLRWFGTIASVAPHGAAVRLLVKADTDLLADVTPAAAHELGLHPGRSVWLSVKATAVSRYGDNPTAGNIRP